MKRYNVIQLAAFATGLVTAFALDMGTAAADAPTRSTAAIDAASNPSSNAASNPVATDVLFANFAKSTSLYARFHEEKTITLLVAPLKSDGTLHFARQYGLARHTLSPSKQSVVLVNGTLAFWDGTKTEVVRLDRAPALRAFADGFDLLLRGDRAGIERSFQLEFSGAPQGDWQLRLVPRTSELRAMIASLEVHGKSDAVTSLLVKENNGDSTLTTFSDVDPKKVYSAAEAAAVFHAPPGK